jgi:hypothetical protein
MALHAHHPRLRSIRTELKGMGGLMPVRVPRWSLIRLLLLFIEAAKQAAEERQRAAATITFASDERVLTLRARTDAVPLRYAAAMAVRCGAVLTTSEGETTIALPTLLELRKRERAAREAAE